MKKQKKLHMAAACLALSLGLLVTTAFAAEPAAAPATDAAVQAAQAAAQPAPIELSLEQAVNLALTNNPSGKIAVFDYEAAKGTLTATRSYRWPTISYTNKASWTNNGEYYNISNYGVSEKMIDTMSNTLAFNWILWSGNKIESQVSQAKLNLDSSQWGVALARQQL